VAQFRKLEDVLTDAIVDEGFYRQMMAFALERVAKRNQKAIQSGAEVIEVAANLAGSGVGPKYYRKYILEYESRLLRALHESGVLNIFHNCGDAALIMHLYNEMPIDCWGYLTPPPFGDVDLDEALRVMRPNMALRGNIDQVEFLRHATPDEVAERVREVLLKVKPRGSWILSTTDFMSDGTPYENVEAFARAGLTHGAY
jgi:uroporphyrinogen-III decarboxylase